MIATIRVGATVKALHTSTRRMCRREPGGAAPAVEPQLRQPHGHQRDQRHGDDEVGDQQPGDPAAGIEATWARSPASQA